ncbi:MAG: hypothetical protein HY708_00875 [Ignavibacteriae bacterium]|nr:hypothetical protein [Ignavibacteriota bacterium]
MSILLDLLGRHALSQPAGTSHIEALEARIKLVNYITGGETIDIPQKCGLPSIAHALSNRDRLSPDLRRSLDLVLTRPVLQKSIVAGNFRIHYDTVGSHAPAMLDSSHNPIPGTANEYADSAASIIGRVAIFEIDSLGYPAAPPDLGEGGGPEYDIYIMELGNLYGETVFETPIEETGERVRYTTFMRIDNDFVFVNPDSNRGLPALRVTLAHEFHHAIQIGNYGFWSGETYFYEITSTWLEDVLFPEVNDYFQYVRSGSGQFRRPEVSFTTSNGLIEYSRCVWAHYIENKYNRLRSYPKYGRTLMRLFWERIRLLKPLAAMDIVLQEQEHPHETNFRNAFTEWSIWNYFTGARSDTALYYPEGSYYPMIAPTVVDFVPPSRVVSGSLNFLASRYYDVLVNGQPITLMLSNINLAAALANTTTAFPYSFLFNSRQLDESYRSIGGGIFAKLSVADPTNWFSKDIFGASPVATPFPNPLMSDGKSVVNIPISATTMQSGTLTILSSSMDLIYSSAQSSIYLGQLGKHVFRWNGKSDDGDVAATGVYIYVLELPGETIKGKLAVIRK